MQVSSDCMYTRNNTLGIPTLEFIPGSYDYVSSDSIPRMINHAGILPNFQNISWISIYQEFHCTS